MYVCLYVCMHAYVKPQLDNSNANADASAPLRENEAYKYTTEAKTPVWLKPS